jgi:phosphate transport system substrate-binding protein
MLSRLARALGAAALILSAAACSETDLSKLEMDPSVKPVPAIAKGQKIKIVGSSTVAPFSRTVAERFGAVTRFPTPIVESTGTGGGFRAFCEGAGPLYASIANASRPITPSEIELCARNGVTGIAEVAMGYDGIVLGISINGPDYRMTLEQLYLALAAEIPDGRGGFVPNPYNRWSDISPDLPDTQITVFGQPPTSGTRDAFVELAMEPGARAISQMEALRTQNRDLFREKTHTLRTDGRWIDFGEHDSAIIQSLIRSPEALGVLGFSFLEQNADRIKGTWFDGVEPTFDNIASGEYGLARLIYFYAKEQNLALVDGLAEFIAFSVDDDAAGPEGYLLEQGLIPLPPQRLEAQQAAAEAMRRKVRAY